MPKSETTATDAVATDKQNAKLEHSEGGTTTREDVTDLGVPMLAGDPAERVGPEDALGVGPKRGDYRNRLGGSDYHPHQFVAVPDAAPGEPTVRVEVQSAHAADIGDETGKKGGVDAV